MAKASRQRQAQDLSVKVAVTGLREVVKGLKAVSDDNNKELKDAFKQIAEEIAQDIRPKVPIKSGRARASIVPRGYQNSPAIAFGGKRAKHMPWLEFGGTLPRGQTRPFISGGRYVFPTIKEKRPEIAEKAEQALLDVARKAGFEVRG